MFGNVKTVKNMSGLDLMRKRLGYLGCNTRDGHNVTGKYKSFLGALKDSYQAENITLDKGTENERPWRCLINASRLTENFDKKVLSIDFASGVKEGTVFWWDRTKRYWMVSLQQHTEEAYFRGLISRADYKLVIDDNVYWAVVRGPIETETDWQTKHSISFNKLNYSLVLQIQKNSQTVDYFTRHKVTKISLAYPDVNTGELIEEEHNWKIVATDKYSSESIIEVYLDEWNDNSMEDAEIDPTPPKPDTSQPYIDGPRLVYGFDTNISYSIVGLTSGEWTVNSNKVKINLTTETSCIIDILTGKPTKFILTFVDNKNGKKVEQEIVVQSF